MLRKKNKTKQPNKLLHNPLESGNKIRSCQELDPPPVFGGRAACIPPVRILTPPFAVCLRQWDQPGTCEAQLFLFIFLHHQQLLHRIEVSSSLHSKGRSCSASPSLQQSQEKLPEPKLSHFIRLSDRIPSQKQ